jgi:hypothetical protein
MYDKSLNFVFIKAGYHLSKTDIEKLNLLNNDELLNEKARKKPRQKNDDNTLNDLKAKLEKCENVTTI